MSSDGYLVPPSEKPEQAELWNETWKRLDRFLPGLFAELFPEHQESFRRVSREIKAPSSTGVGSEEVKEVKREEPVEGDPKTEKDEKTKS
jgi:brefeldin A-resistance guanine nucleotide exchange factor 1